MIDECKTMDARAGGQTEGQVRSLPAPLPGQALGGRQDQYSYLQQVAGPASSVDDEVHCGRTREERVGRGGSSPGWLPGSLEIESVHPAPRRALAITSST